MLVRTYAYILFTIWILPLWRLLNYEAHDERVSVYKMEPLTAHLVFYKVTAPVFIFSYMPYRIAGNFRGDFQGENFHELSRIVRSTY